MQGQMKIMLWPCSSVTFVPYKQSEKKNIQMINRCGLHTWKGAGIVTISYAQILIFLCDFFEHWEKEWTNMPPVQHLLQDHMQMVTA